jgi:hypothetical protein
VPFNSPALHAFRHPVIRRWHPWLNRRSPRASVTWERMNGTDFLHLNGEHPAAAGNVVAQGAAL